MRLPWIVRQIGNASGKDRIYIEDYACSFLENCRKEESLLPVRAALYGYALQKGESHIYLIYGVSHIAAELQQGMSQEQIQEMFFSEYELIGYVNLYAGQTLFENPTSQDSSACNQLLQFVRIQFCIDMLTDDPSILDDQDPVAVIEHF